MGQHTSNDHAPHSQLIGLRDLFARHRPEIGTVVLYAACVGLFALATPIAVQALVNTAAFGTVMQPIFVLVVMLLTFHILANALKVMKTWVVEMIQRRLFLETVARVGYRLPCADAQALRLAGREHLVHRFFDLFTVQKTTASLLLGGIDAVLAACVGMLVLAFYHPFLLAFDLLLIAMLAFVVFGLGRRGVPTAIQESSHKYDMAGFLSEIAGAPFAYRDRGGMAFAHAQLDHLAERYLVARASHFRIVLRQFTGALFIQVVASAGLLGLGGWLVIERELSLGQLVAAELIVATVVGTLTQLGKHVETYYDLVASSYKLQTLTDLPTEEQDEDQEVANAAGPAELAVEDLHVDVDGRPLFSGAAVSLPARSRVAFVGPAESGKTYLLDLLFGLSRPHRGHILVDGTDTREMSRSTLRERVAIVRGPEIAPTTVIENVRLGRKDISPGRVRSLLEDLGLTEELMRLPQGLDTMLGPAGAPLSDSQALRVTIARAVARSPGLIAIDSELSSINPQSLQQVLRFLCRPEAPWTLIFVAEDPQVVRHCDMIVRFGAQKLAQESVS